MNKTRYKDIVEIADTYGVEAAILLTSCESESDVQWARAAVAFEENFLNFYEKRTPRIEPIVFSLISKEAPVKVVIEGRFS